MRNVVITGGAGFIGSHVVERLRATMPEAVITVLDKMTYAADLDNIAHLLDRHRTRLVVGDICDFDVCVRLLKDADLLVHLAAESHVDNSFGDSLLFTRTNALGTHTLLEACRMTGVGRILHVSTDEVYGEVLSGEVDETAHLNPTNPYSASKASAEMVVKSYVSSFRLPIVIVRANNIFGIRQYPEKLIPRCCLSLLTGKKIPIHGTGEYRRHYLAAQDFAEAVDLLIRQGEVGQAYNIGSEDEYTNLQVAEMICGHFGVKLKDAIEFVSDRPFNDARYSISSAKIRRLGWQTRRLLKDELPAIVAWYRDNLDRYVHPDPVVQSIAKASPALV